MCRIQLILIISDEAAKRVSEITSNLDIIEGIGQGYLSEKIIFYLNEEKIDELNIGAELKGKVATDIIISSSGRGSTQEEGIKDAQEKYDQLIYVLLDYKEK